MLSIPWAAACLGLVPLAACLLWRPADRTLWWLATAFAISFAADLATALHWLAPWTAMTLYLVSQTGLIALTLVSLGEALLVLAAVSSMAFTATFGGLQGPDVLVHTTAFLSIVLMARSLHGALRASLVVTFGFGLLAWWGYVIDPGLASWAVYQMCRVVGVGLFAKAVHQEAFR